jgi:SAM-dependent methyltransferase
VKPSSADEVLEAIEGAATAAALGAAIELGLFWLIERRAMQPREVAEALGIPPARCGYWLQVLAEAGLLDRGEAGFHTSEAGRRAVVSAYSQPTWALLAEEARERLRALQDMPQRLATEGPAPEATKRAVEGAYDRMAVDPAAARRFTRMLYEVHLPLARELAAFLDLGPATRLMDLGGGSAVMSIELARRHPSLSATVVDLANVCAAGEEIVAAEGLGGRIRFHPADFLHDPLPGGFDAVLECDVNVYGEELFRKVRAALGPAGRFLIVDQFAPAPGEAAPTRVHWALAGAMLDPAYTPPSLPGTRALLERAGFHLHAERPFNPSPAADSRFSRGMTVIDARV